MSQWDHHRNERTWTDRFERPFCILALICVLMMPSIYKGGATTPHAHGFFQFWFTGLDRAFDHHYGLENHSGAHSDEHQHHLSGTAQSGGENPVSASDEVTISPETAPGGIASTLLLLVLTFLGIAFPRVSRWRFPTLDWIAKSRSIVPESPPPQVIASC